MPISPSSLTITAVSPMSGWRSRCEISVVLPLPRKPVTTVSGVLSAKRPDQLGIERVERPAGEPLGLLPEHPQVGDDRSASLCVAEHVRPAAPVVEPQPEVLEHAVQQHDAEDAAPPAALLLGPVVAEQDAAERAH